ncbi:hypothetical protein R3P38DRAFT_2822035 [Favolaschia claudopus]|uniref:Lipase-like C-terminal domain-containing protein n=1 Tax=Favolaschia claudopus TaxID=2862362 RepID=A0AAW0EF39_9AGAR
MTTTDSDRYDRPGRNEPIPLVIVQGFLGTNGAWMWGNFEQYLNHASRVRRKTIFVSVGPVSSLHDRACELYYALLGGTVDYGMEHSISHKHARYGRNIAQGQYPDWSPTRPLHFLAHSMGGPTVIKLQDLIRQGHFGPTAQTPMILSINAISAPFRGSGLVYLLGERADAAPAVQPLSVGSILGKWVHVVSYLSPLVSHIIDFHGDSRSLTYRDISFFTLLQQLWRSDWAESTDATPFDVTFQAADERESQGEGVVDAETFYQSHVAEMTRRHSQGSNFHAPPYSQMISPLMYLYARLLGKFDYSTIRPRPSFLSEKPLSEEFWANDGAVPTFSQWHPLSCCHTLCRHLPVDNNEREAIPKPGVWYVKQEFDAHHMSLVPLWMGTDFQKQWWKRLGWWLSAVDETLPYRQALYSGG